MPERPGQRPYLARARARSRGRVVHATRPDGLFEAWANLYTRFAIVMDATDRGDTDRLANLRYPDIVAGVEGVRLVENCVCSAEPAGSGSSISDNKTRLAAESLCHLARVMWVYAGHCGEIGGQMDPNGHGGLCRVFPRALSQRRGRSAGRYGASLTFSAKYTRNSLPDIGAVALPSEVARSTTYRKALSACMSGS